MTKEIVFVPHWMAATIRRKGMSITSLLDYSKIRQIFSLNDLAGLLCVQDGTGENTANNNNVIVPFSNKHWFGHLLSSWNKSATSAQALELDSTVKPLSHSDDVRGEILSRFEEVDDMQDDRPFFELIDVERGCVFIIMNPGFIKGLQDPEVKFDLVRKILKVFYVHNSVRDVSRTDMFGDYVAMLEGKIWN